MMLGCYQRPSRFQLICEMKCINSIISNNNHEVTLLLRQSYGDTDTSLSLTVPWPRTSINFIIFSFPYLSSSHEIVGAIYYLLAVRVDLSLSFLISLVWSFFFGSSPKRGSPHIFRWSHWDNVAHVLCLYAAENPW